MLILKMLLRITGFTQEGLANFVGVTRASINSWLVDDSSMTISSKQNFADKFQFPISYFDIDLDQDLNLYKVVFSTLYESWKRINTNIVNEDDANYKICRIMNEIESNFTKHEYKDLSDLEILAGLANGYNPFTGEFFDDNHILNNDKVQNVLSKIQNDYIHGNIEITKDDLNEKQFELFEKLRQWRKNKTSEEGYFSAYIVFTDKELINIILTDIKCKQDLRKVKGIGDIKYNKYADELFDILTVNNAEGINQIKQKANEKTDSLDPFVDFAASIKINDNELPF